MKTITIPDCMHPAFELILNGIPYRYPAGQTVTVPDEIAALIAAHSEHHDAKHPGQEVQPPFRSDNIAEAPVLDAATENTHVLVVENGTTMQLPASSLGGSSGATIHVEGSADAIYPSDAYTKYKVGDLLYATENGSLFKLDDFSKGSSGCTAEWTQIYPATGANVEIVRADSIDEAIANHSVQGGGNDEYEGRLLAAVEFGDGTCLGLAVYSLDWGWMKFVG